MRRFPLFRLATLLARQLSAPVAKKIKVVAVNHPWFQRHVCARTGRMFHAYQLRLRLWTLALRQPRHLPPISDHVALESGASILGEAIIFGVGGLIIMFEVNRQANKQEDKVLAQESQWLALLLSLEELQRELALQQQDIDRLHATLRRLAPDQYPRTQQDSQPSSDQPVMPSPPTSESPPVSKPTAELDAERLPPTTSEAPPPPKSDCPPPLTPECPLPPTSECSN
ncbi:optic atrophy 3 protein homolog isoform X1 [Spodoptera litura]|uniref:Optic atrophy 3 protein homolog isoform X1 n=2 Tax=Spodoptera litura TaxID=69820 RepID=A0A9J7E200_SPOLT|nr:optic atrophy 3 protein homolog isoform X1 [Spodoptera litura]